MFRVTRCDHVPTGRKIVKGGEYAAALTAERIVAQARAAAETTAREAQEEYQRQKQRGYNDGLQQAQAAAAKRMLTAVAETAVYFSNVEDRVVGVVRKSLRKMLGDMDEHDLLVRAARHALNWARNQSRVTLRVSPAQASRLQLRVEEIRRDYPVIAVLDVEADDRLEALDCILETEVGSVNASIDVQLAAIEAALHQAVHGELNDEAAPPNQPRVDIS
jgi:type III secretion protein L